MRIAWWMSIFVALLPCMTAQAEDAGELKAKLILSDRVGERIEGLVWSASEYPVERVQMGDTARFVVHLRGNIKSPKDRTLLFEENLIQFDNENGDFNYVLPLAGEVTTGQFFSVSPYGKVEREKVVLVFPGWQKFVEQGGERKPYLFGAGASLTYLNYQEQGQGYSAAVTEMGLTVKGNASYQLISNQVELGANAFLTAVPIMLSNSPSGLSSARWYGINGRVGFRLPIESATSSYWLMTGWYFWGMLVSNTSLATTYGVASLGGPQVFLSGRYVLSNGHPAYVYLKYASITDIANTGIFSFSNVEYAGGAGYTVSQPGSSRSWVASIDAANAQFSGGGQSFQLLSLSVGFSTNF